MFFEGGFPFGGMPGMGGMPGHGGMGGPPRGDVDNKKFYELLGVPQDADTATIKKAYRKLALAHHPDRGGDAEKFKEISKAHEVLTDPEKRKIYDQLGEEGLEGGGSGGGPDAADIFSAMFGGGGRGQPRVRRGEDTVHEIKVTLNQLYSGATKKMALHREVLCKSCKGHGTRDGKPADCAGCGGRGRRRIVQRMGNMIAQQDVVCSDCRGKGTTVTADNKCQTCSGQCLSRERETLEVVIEKGMRNNQKVVFKGKGDEKVGFETGDVIFVLNEEPHETFKRVGEHLVIKHKITLLEALTGFKVVVNHLDGRKLVLHSKEGHVYKPGDKLIAKNEGMPIHGRSFNHGHLVVDLEVEFPKTMAPEHLKALSSALPAGKPVKLPENAEDHYLEDGSNIDLTGKQQRGNRNAYDDEDDEDDDHHHGHGPQVGCQQA